MERSESGDSALSVRQTFLRSRHKTSPTACSEETSEMQMPMSHRNTAHGQSDERRGGDSLNDRLTDCIPNVAISAWIIGVCEKTSIVG